MLYMSTRNKTDSFTAYRTIHNEQAPDGGKFVPFHMPALTDEQKQQFQEQTFCKTVADVLNLFFSCGLTEWDLECSIGRSPVRIAELGGRLLIAELWHNPEGSYCQIEKSIFKKLATDISFDSVCDWAKIAIRVAVIAATYFSTAVSKFEEIDISVPVGDFTMPMAAWYARKMGLPVGTIICGCNDNSAPWDLICRGEMNTGLSVVRTQTPALDFACPSGLERLIFETLGYQEAARFAERCAGKLPYRIDVEEQLPLLNSGVKAAVIGDMRVDSTLRSLFKTDNYIADPYCAVALGAVQDHRAKSGENRTVLLFADNNPAGICDQLAGKIGITREQLLASLNTPKEI